MSTAERGPAAEPAPGPHGTAFSGRVGWGARPAVLVIDLVRAYTEPGGPFALPHPEPAVAATAELVAAARAGGHLVVWTVVRYAAGLADGGLFVRKVPALAAFAEDAPGNWGALTLAPEPGEPVLVKQYASAFFGTPLAATLHTAGVDTVIVAGVSTSGCVRASAMDALNSGFRPQVVRQACADRSPELHESNLADLDAKYADVTDLAEALAHL
jgi:maleamate amidohydrolase